MGRKEARRRAALREWRKSALPFAFAVVVHGLLAWLVIAFLMGTLMREDLDRTLTASFEEQEDLDLVEEPPEEPELEEPEPPELPIPELMEELEEETDSTDDQIHDMDLLGLGASGGRPGGGARNVSAWGTPDALRGLEGGDSPFRGFIDDLRARGLDVVFIVDATGSMQRFIDRARAAIDDIIADLAAVVPTLRLAIVAYRDLGDEWITRRTDLTDDRYHIHNFLIDLEAAGGKRVTPDFEEAVEVGLSVAANELSWRKGARRVMILVGDAPYHDDDQSAALATVRSFARDVHSLVNTVYVGNQPGDRPTRNQLAARDAWQKIARTGDGVALELLSDEAMADTALRKSVTDATFGPTWADEIAGLLARTPHDSRIASVERHVERSDRKWLIRRMGSLPLHPAVPEGCLALFDGLLAAAMYEQLADATREPPLRSAALYVLKRKLEPLQGLALDVYAPLAGQEQQLASIRFRVRKVPGAERHLNEVQGSTAPPPPIDGTVSPPPELPGSR